MRKLVNLLFLSICFVSVSAYGQFENDSLKSILSNNSYPDSLKIKLLIDKSHDTKTAVEKRFDYLDHASKLAIETKNKRNELRVENTRAILFKETGDLGKALATSQKAVTEALNMNDSTLYISFLQNRGNIFKDLGEFDKAFNDYNSILKFHETRKDNFQQAKVKITIGIIYAKNGEIEKALSNLFSADSLLQTSLAGIPKETILELRNKVNINIGATYQTGNNFDKAIEFYEKALQLSEYSQERSKAHLIFNVARIYMLHYKDNESALTRFYEANEIYKRIGNEYFENSTNEMIAEVLLRMNRFEEAKKYALQSLDYANKQNILPEKVEASGILSEIYYYNKEYKKAYEARKSYSHLKDSLFNERKTKAIEEIETKYETEKKEAEIKNLSISNQLNENKLKQTRKVLLAMLLAAVLFTLFILYFIQNLKKKKQTEKLEAQIASREELRGIIAAELHDKVCSDLVGVRIKLQQLENNETFISTKSGLEKVLEQVYTDTRNISKELKSPNWGGIEINKFILKIGKETGLLETHELNLQTSSSGNWEKIQNNVKTQISLVLREVFTNIIKHANANSVKVITSSENKNISIEIEDNGVGLANKGKGNGLENCKKRLKSLKGQFEIKNNGNGVSVKLMLPV